MGSDWRTARIEKIAEKVACGPFGSSIKVSTFVDKGVPVISGQHLHGIRLKDGEFNYITLEHADKLSNANVYPGDVIFTHAGNIGQAAFIPENSQYKKYVLSQRQFYLRPDCRQVLPEFITYFFHSPEGRYKLLANASQTGVPSIARPVSYLKSIEIPIPPLPEQRAIAHILGSLDDKIELNRRMNKALEATARSIFKSWFVDFDPVRAKAESRPTGLPDDITVLFTDSFEDSELGEIPKGWNPSNIGSEFYLTMGQSPPGKTYNETGNGLPFFQGRRDFGFRYPSNRVYCTAPQRLADHGDTLVSVRAPVGDINMAMERCCVGRGVAAVRHKSGSRSYTYYAMHTLSNRFTRFDAEGTVFGAINKKQFEGLRWLSPDDNLVDKFEKIAFAFDEQIEKNTNETETLASLRDTLLPKLISGELRVPDTEKFVEEAGV
jgi:type I restriction enzyme S subunit